MPLPYLNIKHDTPAWRLLKNVPWDADEDLSWISCSEPQGLAAPLKVNEMEFVNTVNSSSEQH